MLKLIFTFILFSVPAFAQGLNLPNTWIGPACSIKPVISVTTDSNGAIRNIDTVVVTGGCDPRFTIKGRIYIENSNNSPDTSLSR